MSKLAQRAVLMRLSLGLPGQSRKDDDLTEEVMREHSLGADAGKWDRAIYPPEALRPIKALDNEITKYHDRVTLPFDKGVGILPGGMIFEYSEKMREFKSKREALVQTHFVAKYDQWVSWARQQHNGTFDESLYPGASIVARKFYLRTQPVPVPDSAHFETSVKDLLGLDADSVNAQVEDATKQAQIELMRRMIEPLEYMATTLKKEKPRIYDTMVEHLIEIADIAPKLNLTDDPAITTFAEEIKKLAEVKPDDLRKKTKVRTAAQQAAEELFKRVSAYKL